MIARPAALIYMPYDRIKLGTLNFFLPILFNKLGWEIEDIVKELLGAGFSSGVDFLVEH